MGIQIKALGRGSPGVNGVPGDTFTNKELFKKLKAGLPFWRKAVLKILPGKQRQVERSLRSFEKLTGIKERQMLIADTAFPNECLATASGLSAINEMKKINPFFSPGDIGGFIMVTDTQDTVFPVSGKAVEKALGIKAKHYGNSQLACSSIANAIQQASMWFEHDDKIDYVMIAACDVTSRLHQVCSQRQPFLFADQGVSIILSRTPGNGGFQASNIYLDTNAPDLLHFPLYAGDSNAVKEKFLGTGKSNDEMLKEFGRYDIKSMASMLKVFHKVNEENYTPGEKLIMPQVAQHLVNGALQLSGLDYKQREGFLAESTVPKHAITGAAATPLAIDYLNNKQPLSKTKFTAMMAAIGGVDAIFTYNPNAKKIFEFKYELTPETFDFGENGTPKVEAPPELPVQAIINDELNGVLKKDLSIDRIVNEIFLQLKIPQPVAF